MTDIAHLGIKVDSKGVATADRSLDKLAATSKRAGTATENMVAKFQSLNRILGRVALAGGAAMTAFAASSLKAAIAAEETASKFQVVFRGSVEKSNQALIELTRTIPMTVNEMRGMASGIQDMLVPMGLVREEAAGLSVEAIKLAGDIASFNNVKPAEALQAMQSALAGQSEPLRRFGIDVSQTRLKTLALAEGLIGVGDELTANARAQATFIAVTRDSADAMGDAARTINSTANQLKFMRRDITQSKEDLGKALIPAFRELLEVLNAVGEDGLTPLQAGLQNVSAFILNTTKVVLLAVAGWKILANTIADTVRVLSTFDAGDWGAMFAAGPGGAAGIGATAAQAIADKAASAKAEIVAIRDEVAKTDAELVKTLDSLFAVIAGIETSMDTLGKGVNNTLGEAKKGMNDVADSAEGMGRKVVDAMRGMSDEIANELADSFRYLDDLVGDDIVKAMQAEIKALEGGAEAWREYEKAMFRAQMVAELGPDASDAMVESIEELADRLYDLKNPVEDFASAWENVGSALSGVGGAAQEVFQFMAEGVERGTKEYRQLEVAMAAANVVAALGAVLNQGNGDPYTAWARMATMAAALGVAIGGLDGGFTDTAAERQESQGTGSVLGDLEAKSESIINATEITADATSELVGINRGMLNALERLNSSITGATTGIARDGLGSGYSGVQIPDYSYLADPFGIFDSIGLGFIDNIFNSIFGGKSKITDQGVAILAGGLQDMIEGTLIKAFQEVQYKKWVFGNKKTREELVDLGGDSARQIGLIFEALADAVTEGALALGLSASEIESAMAAFRIEEMRISLKDLSAEDAAAELQAVFSKIFDDLALAVVPFLGQFQMVGEGLGETLIRVATSVQVMQEALKQFGWDVAELGVEAFAQMSVALIELSGGISEFISKMQNFVSKFASEQHIFQIASDAINSAFAQMGVALPDTRDGLWDLMQSLDPIADAETIARILDLTDYLDTYYDMLEDIAAKQAEIGVDQLDALSIITRAAERLGITLQELDSESAEDLLKLAGGIDVFWAKVNQLIALFAPEQFRIDAVMNDFTAAMTELGMIVPNTRDDFWALIQSLDLTSEQLLALMDLAPLAGEYYAILEQQEQLRQDNAQAELDRLKALGDAIRSFVSAFAPEDIQFNAVEARLRNALGSVGLSIPATADALWDMYYALDLSTEAGIAQRDMLLSLIDQFSAYYGMIEDRETERLRLLEEAARIAEEAARIAEEAARAAAELAEMYAQNELDRLAEIEAMHEQIAAADQARIQALADAMDAFFDAFAPDDLQFTTLENTLKEAFNEVGLTLPETAAGLWELYNALDLSTDAGLAQRDLILDMMRNATEYYNLLDKAAQEELDNLRETERLQQEAAQVRQEAFDAEIAALLHIQDIAEGVVDSLTSLRDMIVGDMSTPEENYQRARAEAERLAASLVTMTDPDQINATVAQIEELFRSAYGGLDDVQKQQMGGQFLAFIDQIKALSLDRLGVAADDALSNTAFTPAQILERFNSEVIDPLILVAGLWEDAANTMIGWLIGGPAADYEFQGPVDARGSQVIGDAVRDGIAAGSAAMRDAAVDLAGAVIVAANSGQNSSEAVADAINSLPSRIEVRVTSSEFA